MSELVVGPVAPPEKPREPQPGFGWVKLPNPGSQNYPLGKRLLRAAFIGAAQASKTWQMGARAKALIGPHGIAHSSGRGWQSQSDTSHCVRYGTTHGILCLEPDVHSDAWTITEGLYPWAQEHDFWPGGEPSYFGTSVDAGLQYMLHVVRRIVSYHWPSRMDEVRARLTATKAQGGGSLVCGSDFYSGMSNQDEREATLRDPAIWTPDGNWWGGHCWVARGWKKATARRSAKVLTGNSHLGNFEGEMDADAFEWLIFQQGGECAAVTELRKAA